MFPSDDPLGQMVRFVARGDERSADDLEPMEIVGIAPPIREDVIARQPTAHIYLPWGRTYRSEMHLHVRSVTSNPAAVSALLATLRGELRAVDPDLPVLELSTMQRFHDTRIALWGVRAASRMLTAFGVLALTLAVIGVYGVKAYLVSQRTREIGIRMALGASSADVRSLVLRESLGVTAAGLALGLPLAALLGMGLRGMLLDVSSLDPLVFIGAPALLAAASMLASYVPARRAAQVAPLTALRSQ